MICIINFLYILEFEILKSADKSINLIFLYLKNIFVNFCASPFGNDKKTKFKLFQLISFIDEILGNFYSLSK